MSYTSLTDVQEATMATTSQHPVIVLLERDPQIQAVVQRMLALLTRDCQIITARNLPHVFSLVAKRQVTLLISNYDQFGINGFQLTEAVKRSSPTTQVLIITGSTEPSLEARAQAAGVDFFLLKPFALQPVEAILRAVLPAENLRPPK